MMSQVVSTGESSEELESVLLTEEELLQSSEDDYMNKAQLAFFKNRLVQMKHELLANAKKTSQHLQEHEFLADSSDRATLEEEYALELRTRDRERKLLAKIDSAVQRIENDAYGYCEDTGEPIGLGRLLARPTATLSVEAQEKRERLKRQYAD